VKDEYVFPQTPAEDENFNRTGGLTKRELLIFMCFTTGRAASYQEAIEYADGLLDMLEETDYRVKP
jgi:hypothetical protein